MRLVLLTITAALLAGCVATKIVTVPVRVAAKTVGTVAKTID